MYTAVYKSDSGVYRQFYAGVAGDIYLPSSIIDHKNPAGEFFKVESRTQALKHISENELGDVLNHILFDYVDHFRLDGPNGGTIHRVFPMFLKETQEKEEILKGFLESAYNEVCTRGDWYGYPKNDEIEALNKKVADTKITPKAFIEELSARFSY